MVPGVDELRGQQRLTELWRGRLAEFGLKGTGGAGKKNDCHFLGCDGPRRGADQEQDVLLNSEESR